MKKKHTHIAVISNGIMNDKLNFDLPEKLKKGIIIFSYIFVLDYYYLLCIKYNYYIN